MSTTSTSEVVGGGCVAGRSAPVFTARHGLDTVVLDAGELILRRNAHVENVPGFPAGVNGQQLFDLLDEQAEQAGCGQVTATVESVEAAVTNLGFGALQRRHETLASHRDRCEELARERQVFLEGTTNDGIDVGVRHRSVLPYLYQDFPVDHPVLATAAELDQTCWECQRAVRDHLVRRA